MTDRSANGSHLSGHPAPGVPHPGTPAVDVAVVIVNYGTPDLALAAVESVLRQQNDGLRVVVHVVDNASPGGDAGILATAIRDNGWDGAVHLHAELVNLGFGRGNNVAFDAVRHSGGARHVLLLNPDARLHNEAVAVLARFLDDHPRAACAGASVTKPDGRPVTAAFRFPSLVSEFSDSLGFGPVARLCWRWQVALPPDTATSRVDWVTGAAVMLRWTAIEEVGGFDPGYFLYFEEVDLMRRLTGRGWEVWHVAEAAVVHVEGASTGVRSGDERPRARPDYWYDSWLRYYRTHHGQRGALAFAYARRGAWTGADLIARVRGRPSRAPAAWRDGFSRRVMRPLRGRPAAEPGPAAAARPPAVEDDDINPLTGLRRGSRNGNPRGIGFLQLVREDFVTHDRDFLAQGFWALFWHRFGNLRMSVRVKILRAPLTLVYRVMFKVTEWLCGISLPYNVPVGRRVRLDHFGGMVLVPRRIGNDVVIRQNTTLGIVRQSEPYTRPTICDGVDIGAGAVIVGDIVVGAGAIVGANSVVTRSVPPGAVVAGVPARLVRGRDGSPFDQEATDLPNPSFGAEGDAPDPRRGAPSQ